jgi:EAL domain-containing protein (putative c-di-GMP-specific phosphodiesterase class I)
MLDGLRNIFAPTFVPYADPKATIPLGAVLKNEWFELWYQPKIELKTLRLVGAEALARARHPTRGIVPPAMFLPGAGSDSMHALTERVILTALGDWEDFAECGVPIKLSVNVPVSALVDLPIPQMLREARPSAENWPGLTLEVTGGPDHS